MHEAFFRRLQGQAISREVEDHIPSLSLKRISQLNSSPPLCPKEEWSRPTALQDRTRDSDEDDLHDRDYDVAALANNLSQAFRYKIYGNEDGEEDHGALDRDDEDVYFDDESAEVVISSLRLGDDQGRVYVVIHEVWVGPATWFPSCSSQGARSTATTPG
ncbi:hypothetical protein CK203_074165 [Vitis vinifera]|uniref:Uncharacterized protein n=1 Tax=Vitis vinifera TaxID=29760 RepID=A0A438DTH6_VITVI|nr:hypothetical protein CK203_074165 [Vitis vinifera]